MDTQGISTHVLVSQIDHVGLTVPDLDAAVEFYCGALDARVLYRLGPFDSHDLSSDADPDWTATHVCVKDGCYQLAMIAFPAGGLLELFQYDRPEVRRTTPPQNSDIGGHHIAFTVGDLAAAVARAVGHGGRAIEPIFIEAGSDSAGSWPALHVNYVQDPWGNQLEFVFYPGPQ